MGILDFCCRHTSGASSGPKVEYVIKSELELRYESGVCPPVVDGIEKLGDLFLLDDNVLDFFVYTEHKKAPVIMVGNGIKKLFTCHVTSTLAKSKLEEYLPTSMIGTYVHEVITEICTEG